MAHTLRDGSAHALSPPPGDRSAPRTDWLALSVAILAPIVIIHACVVSPTLQQLAQMRSQVAHLEGAIQELQSKAPAAGECASLLASLNEQEAVAAQAEKTLDRIATLQHRLAARTTSLARSAAKLDRLAELDEQIDRQGNLLAEAADGLATYAAIPEQLERAVDRAGRAAPAIAELERLGDKLAIADELTGQALEDVEIAVDQQRQLVLGAASLSAASETLEGLVELESRLNAPLMAVGAAHERLDSLVQLKTSVLDQTANLPAAFDTFELMVSLQTDYGRASGVLRTMQRLMADMVLLEPTISRVAASVQPMIQRTTLEDLGGSELRLVLQELRHRHTEAVRRIELAEQTAAPSRAERIAAKPEL